MAIDKNIEYDDTFNEVDLFISDPSSMISEFFATKKPIIYTKKID